MRAALLLASLLAAGCGNKIVYVIADLGSAKHDLAVAVEQEQDLAAPVPPPEDMHVVLPPDLFQACTSPEPGFYNEYVAVTYTSTANSTPASFSNIFTVIVRNDGVFERPADNMTAPNFFHCMTPPAIDSKTCLAACCVGDAAIVPSVYYDGKGWRLFKAGTCSFRDPNSVVVYTVQFTSISGGM